MSIYKSCQNCIYSDIWADKSKAECSRFPEVVDIEDRQFGKCGYHELDYDYINRKLGKWENKVDRERRALKREIKRLGSNPRKLGG